MSTGVTEARILLVEDERNLAEGIREVLEDEGYTVQIAWDGEKGLERLRAGEYDLVLLDVMLPKLDGFAVCETVRSEGRDLPVLFLTARGSTDDRIRGLEAGGDDYLTKPFRLKELLLRVAAILRRRTWVASVAEAGGQLSFGGNDFDFRSFQGHSWDGREQTLTHKEAMILKLLADREGEVVSREEILDKVWGYEVYPSTRTIDNFIVRLRRRFEPNPDEPRFFLTVRGVGYRFHRGKEESS